jgi:hypothetical protein
MQQNKGWALQAAEKPSFDLFCNKGTTLVGPQMQQNNGWALRAAEKPSFDLFCNKGTTLVGPQMQQNNGWALAPAAFLHHNRKYSGVFPQPVKPLLFIDSSTFDRFQTGLKAARSATISGRKDCERGRKGAVGSPGFSQAGGCRGGRGHAACELG